MTLLDIPSEPGLTNAVEEVENRGTRGRGRGCVGKDKLPVSAVHCQIWQLPMFVSIYARTYFCLVIIVGLSADVTKSSKSELLRLPVYDTRKKSRLHSSVCSK